MNQITQLYMNYARLEKTPRYRLTVQDPHFSWAIQATHTGALQTACRVCVHRGDTLLWDTGWRETAEQALEYTGAPLPVEVPLTLSVAVRDDRGEESLWRRETFYVAGSLDPAPLWIAATEDEPGRTVALRREFAITGEVESAALYACGLGYHQLWLNGEPIDIACLDPLHADYTESCYYTLLPEVESHLRQGENCFGVRLGEGWRRAMGVCEVDPNLTTVHFFGQPQLSAVLRIRYRDGRTQCIETDGLWQWAHEAVRDNDLFNGERYEAAYTRDGWALSGGGEAFRPVRTVPAPGGVARVSVLEPIVEQDILAPLAVTPLDEERVLVDFGVNIAGVCRLRLPDRLSKGHTITLAHMEMLSDDGSLYMAPARSAKQTDTYVAAGDSRDLAVWQPLFTYHGFRYVEVTGYPLLTAADIQAVRLYSDVDSTAYFRCGSGLVNTIQDTIRRTEQNNLHGLLTDCPQRDERMGWLNDATVRFEETPYNFRIARLFPKVIQDILDTQGEDGTITCTAPHVFGNRPADPVCSSFLVAGLEAYLHTGNLGLLRDTYDSFARWQGYLASRAVEHIIPYSYYGDWAGPEYACDPPYFPCSAVTPGDVMSTGYYYYNARLLERFAGLLGRTADMARYGAMAEEIRAAMLKRWWNGETGTLATGSQGCQSFALWLGILPEESRALAAQRLHEDLVEKEYRITTGNLCTRYLFDVLTEYGYIEDAWTLITREEYPSIGYMLQNEATTVWERFELKKSPAMNSHDHPMYGAVGYWFYAYLAGIKPTGAGYETVTIQPYFPRRLYSVQAAVETPKGSIHVRWVRRFGKRHLYVTLPVGVTATVVFDGQSHSLGCGFWHFEAEDVV